MSFVEIKDFNALIGNKPLFDTILWSTNEKLVKISRNDDYEIGHILDFLYHQNYYKLIGIDLSRQLSARILQQINFVVK